MRNFCLSISLTLPVLFASGASAHRDSDIDNYRECQWNQRAAEGDSYSVECNDLYHLYTSVKTPKLKKTKGFKFGAFNIFKLGSGDARFKDLGLTANIIKNYDLIAVSEVQPSTSEEFDSNMNLDKATGLDFKKYYHKPGYLKLLERLRDSNSSWSLVLSPAGQSQTEELLGFYFRADKVKLENSNHCKEYNRNLRAKKDLFFAGGHSGPSFGRQAVTPHLNKSYGCLLDVDADENDIYRVPFSSRFKTGAGFDFQYLSYHARFAAPIVVGGACGFECLEKVNSFLNSSFHVEGAFLKTLDSRGLKFLKNHLDYLKLKKNSDSALFEENGPVIKYKFSKPRIYRDLISVKELMRSNLKRVGGKIWKESFAADLSKKDRDRIISSLAKLFSSDEDYASFKVFVEEKGAFRKAFLEKVLDSDIYAEVFKRYKIWTAPEKIARFYELSLILEGMEEISKQEKDSDVVLGGDLNLEDDANPYYWNFFKDHFKYSTVAIGSPTSISKKSGLSKAYDHFMYDERSSLEECKPIEASVLDFVNERSHWKGFEKYFVKSRGQIESLSKVEFERISRLSFVNSKGEAVPADKVNVRRGFKSCWDGETYKNQSLADVWRSNFECRTLNQYLNGPEPYRIYTDLISDHLPVGMKCSKASDLD